MKRLSNHHDVARAWAEGTRQSGSASNMIIIGDTIYSYGTHFPMGRIVHRDGETFALITTRRYSMSTAKHLSRTLQAALRAGHRIIRCQDVEREHSGTDEANFRAWREEADELLDKLQKARRPDVYRARIMLLVESMEAYAGLFCLGLPDNLHVVVNAAVSYRETPDQAAA